VALKHFYIEKPPSPGSPAFVFEQWLDKIHRFSKSLTKSTTQTGAHTVDSEEYWIRADASSGSVTIGLPPVGNVGRPIGVIKVDNSANAVTVDGEGSETIAGSASVSLSSQYDAVVVRDNGTSWDIELRTFGSVSTSGLNIFKTISVSGQSDVVADSPTDTLTLVGAGGTTITTTAGSDTITITSSGGGEPDDPHWEPVVSNEDTANPELVFADGDLVMVWTT
jgi:hypothetical protein